MDAHKRSEAELREASVVHHPVDDVSSGQSTNSSDITPLIATYSPEQLSSGLLSITVAMFLVLTFTAADLRGGCALLETRNPYNVILGSAMLLSFMMMVLASIKVLFFLSNDDVSFIIGAAAVIFISDVVSGTAALPFFVKFLRKTLGACEHMAPIVVPSDFRRGRTCSSLRNLRRPT